MSWRTTGVLFAVLVLLAALVIWQSSGAPEDEPAASPTAPFAPAATQQPLFRDAAAPLGTITRLEIEPSAGEPAVFRRQADGHWFMTVPTTTAVISQTLLTPVNSLLTTRPTRSLSPDLNPLAAYGLDVPAHRITIAAVEEERTVIYQLFVGNPSPAGSAYYAQKHGDPRVYLISEFAIDNVLNLATDPPVPLPTPEALTPLTTTVPFTP